MVTIREDVVYLLAQFRQETWTQIRDLMSALDELRWSTEENLGRTERKLDKVFECSSLKEQKPIVLNKVKKGRVHKRKTLKRKAKDEAKNRLNTHR